MDTSLKKSKKIRAFVYKIIMIASFFTMIGTSLIGREALLNFYKEGPGTLSGKLYYMTEFREYVSKLYTYGLLGYAGAGDDNGYPLSGENNKSVTKAAMNAFETELSKGHEDILFHIDYPDKSFTLSNFDYPLFSEYDGHLLLPEDVTLCCYWDGKQSSLTFFTDELHSVKASPGTYFTHPYKPNTNTAEKLKLVLALPEKDYYKSDYFNYLSLIAGIYQKLLFTLFISAALFLLSGLCSLLCHRANREMQKDVGYFTQKLWLEWKLLIPAFVIYLCYQINLWYFNGKLLPRFYGVNFLWLYGVTAVLIYLLLNDWKQNKAEAFRHSLTYATLHTLHKYGKSLPWYRKISHVHFTYVISGSLCLVTGITLLYLRLSKQLYYTSSIPVQVLYGLGIVLILAGLLMLFYGLRLKRFLADTYAITAKLTDISHGVSDTGLKLSKHSLLTTAASDLNSIEQGIDAAVEQTIRSNRMRVELITNVSHDLKTPLTSIINYADLLCEENLPQPAEEYAAALRTKAYRLKSMVQDVFELSKATSGNLPIEVARLDLVKLVRQTLADMDERIQESSLTFKLSVTSEPLMIEADGEKLYRVFQNLIINALQYSLENSRVYIQLDSIDHRAVAWVKNTSRQELNFEPDEIVERFVRADSSRTTEGHGLGLSIVQSFTEACGGDFHIDLNADLFTACVSFPLSAKPLEDANENTNNE